jgi:acyl-CoA thioester hydrolase
MYNNKIKVRIRYGETDRMGYAHHANYPLYLEEARMELLRSLGIDYKELEDSGIILPVVTYNIKFIYPVFYDDIITIKTTLTDLTAIKLNFDYKIYNQLGKLVSTAKVVLVYVDAKTRKFTSPPKSIKANYALVNDTN